MLDVLIERQRFCLGRRVIGLEERKAEVVLLDGYVED